MIDIIWFKRNEVLGKSDRNADRLDKNKTKQNKTKKQSGTAKLHSCTGPEKVMSKKLLALAFQM